jgi:hypothetical protein
MLRCPCGNSPYEGCDRHFPETSMPVGDVVSYLRATEKRLLILEAKARGDEREYITAERAALRDAVELLSGPGG